MYTWVDPTPTDTEPHTLAASQEVARLIGLDLGELQRPEFAAIFSGNAPLPGAKPYAQCYGGHQFGYWAGQVRGCSAHLRGLSGMEPGPGVALGLGEVSTTGHLMSTQERDVRTSAKGAHVVAGLSGNRSPLPPPPLQLGDGRAICLGEVVNEAGKHWELQLKVGWWSVRGACIDGMGLLFAGDGGALVASCTMMCKQPDCWRFGLIHEDPLREHPIASSHS